MSDVTPNVADDIESLLRQMEQSDCEQHRHVVHPHEYEHRGVAQCAGCLQYIPTGRVKEASGE